MLCVCPQAIGLYWDEYAARVAELVAAHPEQVRAWDFRAVLNDATAQEEMLRWIGVTEPVLVLGEVTHASKPEPEPEPEPEQEPEPEPEPEPELEAQSTGGWWKELELEEMRQDLAAARQLRHDQTEQLASGGPYATTDTKTENGTEEETENKAQKEPDEGGQAGCLPGKAPPSDRHQHYADTLAWERWYTEAPLRVVNYSLGFPVVVEEPDGYPKPPAGSCVAIAQHSAEVCAASLSISAVFLHSAFNFWNFSLRRCAKQRSDGCQAARRSIPPSIRSRGRADAVA